MPYTLDPRDPTQPLDADAALVAAGELRALKAFIGKIPVVSVNANKTFALADGGTDQLHPSADTATRTWSVPDNSVVAFPVGTIITISVQNGAGTILLTMAGTDVMRLIPTGLTGTRTLPANSVTNIKKITATEWQCVTNGGS